MIGHKDEVKGEEEDREGREKYEAGEGALVASPAQDFRFGRMRATLQQAWVSYEMLYCGSDIGLLL